MDQFTQMFELLSVVYNWYRYYFPSLIVYDQSPAWSTPKRSIIDAHPDYKDCGREIIEKFNNFSEYTPSSKITHSFKITWAASDHLWLVYNDVIIGHCNYGMGQFTCWCVITNFAIDPEYWNKPINPFSQITFPKYFIKVVPKMAKTQFSHYKNIYINCQGNKKLRLLAKKFAVDESKDPDFIQLL